MPTCLVRLAPRKKKTKILLFIAEFAHSENDSSELMRQDLVEFTPNVSRLLHSVKDARMISCKGIDIRWLNPWGRFVDNKSGRVHVEDLSTPNDEMHQLRLVFEQIESKDFGNWTCKGNYGNKSFEMIIYGNIIYF